MTKLIFLFFFQQSLSHSLFDVTHLSKSNRYPRSDSYPNFQTLKQNNAEGTDYRIIVHDRGAPCTALAIHGGRIESLTSELAVSLAKTDMNDYAFEGISSLNNKRLHIASTRFDEPLALTLIKKSKFCISMHGKTDNHLPAHLCLGGQRTDLINKIKKSISKIGIKVFTDEVYCHGLGGQSPQNIVNLCQQPGLQFEMSQKLRNQFINNKIFAAQFLDEIRTVVSPFCSLKNN